jgi:peroxiredoxin
MKKILLISLLISNSLFSQTLKLEKAINCNYNNNKESLDKVDENSSWRNVYPSEFQFPKDFKDPQLIHDIIDYDQVVYQSCNSKIWNNKRLQHFINRWGLDTLDCSPNTINSFINGAIGSINGQRFYILDENNNFNLRDEKIYPVSDSIYRKHSITFERFIKGKITLDTLEIQVLSSKRNKQNIGLYFKYCEYRKTQHLFGDHKVHINLYPGDWYLYHKEPKIYVEGDKGNEQSISNNQYFKVNNSYYKISDIGKKGYSLHINQYTGKNKPTSNQIGFYSPNIQISDSLSLYDLKGKYVYLKFWNIDCGFCENNLPRDFKKYNTDKYKDMFVLLVSVDKPKASNKFLEKNNITWTNIETFGNSNIFNNFGVEHYPMEYLINPNGLIVEKSGCFRVDKYFE